MVVGVVFALCAAVCMGTATVLQALGARRATPRDAGRGRGRTVVEVLRGWPFLAGAGLDTAGFAAQVVALRLVPLFLVEAAVAASLAVTAVVGTAVLGLRLRRAEWGAVALVCLGLATLAVSAGRTGDGHGDLGLRVAVLVASVLVVAGGWVLGGRLRRGRAVVLGAAAGLSFGLTAIAVRLLPDATVPAILAQPAAYAVVVSGLGGYLLLVQALQSGSVTAATAAMVICETVWPGVFGVVCLGDSTRAGYEWLAVTRARRAATLPGPVVTW
ncbi:DMT family transporter [Streptomyces scabiei]|uniref:DMT family transporter n=1 Tax=Streptomyces scabiei TaxID=1930 RepID=UPI00298FAD02|nr:DMT family transporter [Streptomyces scabiei]MDW8806544.1 DMT family transporter [Streptomyces scabiei]